MKKSLILAAMMMASSQSLAAPTISGLRTPGYCLEFGTQGVNLCALQGPTILAMPVILGGGFAPAPPSTVSSISPVGGTLTINGDTSSVGTIFLNGASIPGGASSLNWIGADGFDMTINTKNGRAIRLRANGSDILNLTAGTGTFSGDVAVGSGHIFGASTGDSYLSSVNGSARLRGAPSDGASAVAAVIDASNALSNATSKLVSIRNATVEKSYISFDGSYVLAANGSAIKAVSPNNTLDFLGGAGSTSQAIRFFNSGGTVFFAKIGVVAANPTDVDGQFNISHLAGGSGTPTSPTAGTGCGTSSLPVITGNDFDGQIGVTCGATGTASATIISATFAHAFSSTPRCVTEPGNAAAHNLAAAQKPAAYGSTTTVLTVTASSTALVAGTYLWTYHCAQ